MRSLALVLAASLLPAGGMAQQSSSATARVVATKKQYRIYVGLSNDSRLRSALDGDFERPHLHKTAQGRLEHYVPSFDSAWNPHSKP